MSDNTENAFFRSGFSNQSDTYSFLKGTLFPLIDLPIMDIVTTALSSSIFSFIIIPIVFIGAIVFTSFLIGIVVLKIIVNLINIACSFWR